jgi:ketohexokinase
MISPEELREQCAARLLASLERACHLKAFLGLDGFVDEIIHVVDKRDDAESYARLNTMSAFGQRITAAAGRSTNVEIVPQRTKLGGNGPIMANALARLGVKVTYLGAVGYPNLHPVFNEFARRAEVHSFAEPGQTSALEFEDGKLMLTKTAHFNQINWANIQARFGRDNFVSRFSSADLVGFVNWTMIPYMSDVWAALLREVCPGLDGAPRTIFFDLADPEKRNQDDILRALELIASFQSHFQVILGLNEKEGFEIAQVLGLPAPDRSPEGLGAMGVEIQKRVPVSSLVLHPVTYALSVTGGKVARMPGPYVAKPLITTGAGDHFNSGYCLGKLLGLDDALSLLVGVTSSGFYVRNALSPSIEDLVAMLRDWPINM